MKKTVLLMVALFCLNIYSYSQEPKKPVISILHVDVNGLEMTPKDAGNLVRLELEKLDTFEITDRYDVEYLVKQKNLQVEDCYGKLCLVDVGRALNSDFMLSGTIEMFTKTMIISFRLIDVKAQKILNSEVTEFRVIPEELQTMVQISLRKLLDKPVLDQVEKALTKTESYESLLNNPNVNRLNLSGPRSGFSIATGENARVLQSATRYGGYDTYPVLYMFGYQYEVQYLNEGRYQALFEFVPTITGFSGNIFRPSINILNGFRDNKSGWEFAFGPTFSVTTKTKGAYDSEGNWMRASEIPSDEIAKYTIKERLDSRGNREFSSSVVFALGKTIKSGKVNLPVNLFVIPAKQGSVIGVTLGFNSKKN